MGIKPREVLRFLAGLAIVAAVGLFMILRVAHHRDSEPAPAPPRSSGETAPPPVAPGPNAELAPPPAATPGPAPAPASGDCARGLSQAAQANARSLTSLAWSPFGRPETGWETYAPLIGKEIGSACPPASPDFARALADWKAEKRRPGGGVFSADDFTLMKGVIQTRRPFVQLAAKGSCPAPPTELATARPDEGYAGKVIQLRPAALAAYRRMAADARAADPAIAADPRYLTIFSGYRSPEYDAARCARDNNCDGIARAVACSPHRTGLALDLYVGQAPGFGPDSSAEPNRRVMSRSPAYLWLVNNAARYGFAPYPFEPWHWEWTGERP